MMRRFLLLLVIAAGLIFARGGGGCFLPGTQISTPNGSLAIESVAQGQEVLAFLGDEIVPAHVSEVFQVQRDYYYTMVTDEGSVNATAEHPFYIGNGEFRETRDLAAGDLVYESSGGTPAPHAIVSIQRIDSPTVAYNLHVDGPNTFFANGFAVHNKGGGGGGGGGGFSGGSSHSSGPPPNTFYYDCSGNFNDSGTIKQCCRQTSSTYSTAGSTITNSAYPYCRCGTTQNVQTFSGGSCTCTNDAAALANFQNIPKCPATLADMAFSALCCLTPMIFAILFVFMGKTAFFRLKARRGGWSSTISVPQDKVIQKAKKVGTLLALWEKADPVWSEAKMKSGAKATFLKLQDCWSRRDYTEMAPLMMNDLYAQHVAQLEAMKARHEINRLEDLKLLDLQLVLVNNLHDKSKDNFVAWVNASAKDTIIDDRTNAKIRGDVDAGVFEEFWTFQRDGDAWKLKQIDQPEEGMDVLTKENFDSISTQSGLERQYEKAGGPQISKLGVTATREREEAPVAAMDKIKAKSGRVHRLLNFLAEQDKMWDEEKLVSYSRSMFIAFNVALETRNLETVKNNLMDSACQKYSQMAADLKANGQRIEKRNLAVRNVEIVLVKNYYDNRKDEFTAWVSGQAQTVVVDEKTGRVVRDDGHVADFEEYWTFQRDGEQWKLRDIEAGYKPYVEDENVDEGSSKELMEWYYTKDRAV